MNITDTALMVDQDGTIRLTPPPQKLPAEIPNFSAIDWQSHDGVQLPMINDFIRNQFYDKILHRTVYGRNCVDIGFGTGLLSILALKHGASSVTAYESDQERYRLGQFIIHELGLESKIRLLNVQYNYRDQPKDAVIFSETVNGNLWGESLRSSLPRQAGSVFLPNSYWVEIYGIEICREFAWQLTNHCDNQAYFSPGVDIDSAFVSLINDIGFDSQGIQGHRLPSGIHRLSNGVNTIYGPQPYQRLAMTSAKLMAKYQIDVDTCQLCVSDSRGTLQHTIPFDQDHIAIRVDAAEFQNKTLLLVPRMGMSHNENTLILDMGHWGPAVFPAVCVDPTPEISVTHNTFNGSLLYHYI